MKIHSSKILIILFILMLTQFGYSQTITTSSILDELVDLERLTDFPKNEYVVKHFTSFDRTSLEKARDEKGWFANSDGFGKETIPNFEEVLQNPGADGIGKYLICDVDGPGAIIRTWTARITGNVAVYLDNSSEPLYDGPANPFFIKSYEAMLNIEDPAYEGTFTQYLANYFPIPFAKHCRVVWTGNMRDLHFYYLQIRQYEAGTAVQTFTMEDLKANAEKIEKIKDIFSNPGKNMMIEGETTNILATSVPSGNIIKIAEMKGGKSIQQLSLKVDAKDMVKALRQNVLRIVFDDYTWGQVQAPIGDFFSSAPGLNPVNSLPFTVTANNELICRFVMPFKESCSIYIDNFSDEGMSVSGNIISKDYQWNDKTSMYFHAKWRIDHGLIANNQRAPQDLVYLMARGKGRYVGSTAFIMNPAEGASSWGNWWGEGDEKVFIDNDKFPSVFGTGSEDYYGYAWSSPRIFIFPFIGQPRNDGPGNRGFVTNYRYHITDDFIFDNSLSFFMELFHHDSVPGLSYGRLAYYYGIPGIYDDHQIISPDDVRLLEMPKVWNVKNYLGSAGFTFYQAEDLLKEGKNTSVTSGYMWANNTLLIWKPKQKGETLKFHIPAESGNKQINLTTRQSPESGKFNATLNGKNAFKNEVNLQTEFQINSRDVGLDVSSLEKYNELIITFEGEPGQEIGLDFFWVK